MNDRPHQVVSACESRQLMGRQKSRKKKPKPKINEKGNRNEQKNE